MFSVLEHRTRLHVFSFFSNLVQFAVIVYVCVVSIELENFTWLKRFIPLRKWVLTLFFVTWVSWIYRKVILKLLQLMDLLNCIKTLLLLIEVSLLLHLFALDW